jgi:hypothetical protein
VGDAHAAGQINDAHFAAFHRQLGNGFDIILHDLQSAIAARAAEAFRLPGAGKGWFEGDTRHDGFIKQERAGIVEP